MLLQKFLDCSCKCLIRPVSLLVGLRGELRKVAPQSEAGFLFIYWRVLRGAENNEFLIKGLYYNP